MTCLLMILDVARREKVRNDDLWKHVVIVPMMNSIIKQLVRWFNHI